MRILITGGNGNLAQMIKRNLPEYDITCVGRNDLNILNQSDIENYLNNNVFDILVHTAIIGGRRTKKETADVVYQNVLMFENIIRFADKFKMIINFDSGAIYDRNTDILNRKESDIITIPTDYYGFSKYLIYKRSLQYNNIYNIRIFNIFHANEENDRFIKKCFTTSEMTIEDRYFDFVYEDDFISIIKYYFDNSLHSELDKTINICYEEKYKLSEIAYKIRNDIKITNTTTNYSGDNSLLKKLNIKLIGLDESLKLYKKCLQY